MQDSTKMRHHAAPKALIQKAPSRLKHYVASLEHDVAKLGRKVEKLEANMVALKERLKLRRSEKRPTASRTLINREDVNW